MATMRRHVRLGPIAVMSIGKTWTFTGMTMRPPWVSMGILSFVSVVCGLVAIFDIPTIDKVGLRFWPRKPLLQDEIVRLGALRAAWKHCGWPIEETWKASGLALRIKSAPPDLAEQEALAKAAEGFRTVGCEKLLSQFPDMFHRVGY